MNSFAASAHRRRICLLEFSIVLKVLKLKNNKNKKNIPAGKYNACKWIHPENVAWLASLIPIWLFPFFIF